MHRPALLALALAACAPVAPPAVVPAAPAAAWVHRFPAADTVRVTDLLPGVRHAYLWIPDGPWAVHVIEMDERRCAPAIDAPKAGPPLSAVLPTSALAAGAVAAINADFFMAPGGTPVGAHVQGGRVLVGPGARPVYAVDADGLHRAGPAALHGAVIVGGDTAVLAAINRPADSGRHHPGRHGVALLDRWYAATAPAGSAGAARVRTLAAPGDPARGVGIVVSLHDPGDAIALDDDHIALQPRGPHAAGWLARRAIGDTVLWHAAVVPGGGQGDGAEGGRAARHAVGGFPVLVHDGRGVYHEQTGVIASFGPARHPRTAVGWDEPGRRLFWLVVDGRQPGYSHGMTLPELEGFFLDLGATHAINLDGGGSTTMVVGGTVVSRPSDPDGEREVANALVLEGCR